MSLPGGFTKTGSPLLVFPDKSQFNYLHVTDLHTLLQYYINVVPRSEQVKWFRIFSARISVYSSNLQLICSHLVISANVKMISRQMQTTFLYLKLYLYAAEPFSIQTVNSMTRT